jgi:hypothetical protein
MLKVLVAAGFVVVVTGTWCELNHSELTAAMLPVEYLYGLVVRVPGYRSRGPGSIPGATRLSEK